MPAERCRAAVLDGEEDTEVEPRQPGAFRSTKLLPCANDVCHLERRPFHFGQRPGALDFIGAGNVDVVQWLAG